MTPLGALLAVAVGLALGLFGGGGGVLTVPVLTYTMGVPAKSAVVMSNLVVGTAAAVSVAARWHRREVRVFAAAAFGAASLVAAFAAARLAPWVPATVQLTLLATVMLASAAAMLRSARRADGGAARRPDGARTAAAGAVTGVLTGLTGIGGGVVIVPALVALLGFPLAEASATSLAIIAANSAAAFVAGVGATGIAWSVALPFTALVVAASIGGGLLARHLPVGALKRGFAALLVGVAGFIVYRELIA